MKSAIAIIAALLLAGCEAQEDTPAAIKPAASGRHLERWGPDEFGVICYRRQGMEGISCVKATNPIPPQRQDAQP